jgi:hypothetical protein
MRLLLAWMFAATACATCKCEATFGVCREAATSNVVFAGTVESIAPSFLDTWNENQKSSLELLNREYERAGGDHSPAAFARLRDAYLKVFPDLPPEHKRRLARAASAEQLSELFYWILDHGKRVKFTVRTLYRNGDDADSDDDDAPQSLEIWTAFGECGVNFTVGETYLVYADSDEESDVVTTTACHRTRRLSEAGDDLAYLFFRKNQPKQSARLEVFVTGSLDAAKQRDRDRYSSHIDSPARGVMVVLEDDAHRLRAGTDEYGRAVFDGLVPGEFQVSVFGSGYPQEKNVVVAPNRVRLDARGCGTEVLVTLPPG